MNELKNSTLKLLAELIERYPKLKACEADILLAAKALKELYEGEGKLLACGNGGSAADCEHIVGELMKSFVLKRELDDKTRLALMYSCGDEAKLYLEKLQQPLAAISLVSPIGINTAFANDCDADLIFAQQVLGLGARGDVLLAISTSGNSKNVVHAARVAKAKQLCTIALTGAGGGKLKDICRISICVPETETYKIQELHLPVYHFLCLAAENEMFGADD